MGISVDRIQGLSGGLAVKAPVKVASTANLTLLAEQTVDGVAVVSGDRVLVRAQTNPVDNGIWNVSTGSWSRALDFNAAGDAVAGTLIPVREVGTSGVNLWQLDSDITIGTSSITFSAFSEVAGSAALVSFTPAGTGAVATTVQARLRESVNAQEGFGAVGDGTTSDTAAIQAMFDAASGSAVKEILFPAGTYLLPCNRTDSDYTCAVIIRGLKNVTIRGVSGTKFTQNTSGTGPTEYGFFRVEECDNLIFQDFEMDGSGIVSSGTGANRARGIVIVNHDVNTPTTDLTPNGAIEVHHVYGHNMGGFVGTGVPSSREALAYPSVKTKQLWVHDCRAETILSQDHCVGLQYVDNVIIENNHFVNATSIATASLMDNMAVDISAGCKIATVRNNYVSGFLFGMKCETHVNQGPLSNEQRASERVLFENNVLEEIGHPTNYLWAVGAEYYGIKLNGKNTICRGNTIKERTVGVTTGGLYQAIAVVNTHNEDSHCVVEANYVKGAKYGINHNDTTDTTRETTVSIRHNRFQDQTLYGVLAQANCLVEGNSVHGAGESAVAIQAPINNTIVRKNIAYNCGTTDNAVLTARVVFYQAGTGTLDGFFAFDENVIIDDRGASAAEYGYFLHAGEDSTNLYVFNPGYSSGLLTALTAGKYINFEGISFVHDGVVRAPRIVYTTNSPSAIAPWNAMAWLVGDKAVFKTPGVGSPLGWVCTVAGTPGTWVALANL